MRQKGESKGLGAVGGGVCAETDREVQCPFPRRPPASFSLGSQSSSPNQCSSGSPIPLTHVVTLLPKLPRGQLP